MNFTPVFRDSAEPGRPEICVEILVLLDHSAPTARLLSMREPRGVRPGVGIPVIAAHEVGSCDHAMTVTRPNAPSRFDAASPGRRIGACQRVELVASAEPAIVFSSLAARSVPGLCDGLVVDLIDGAAHYRVTNPVDEASAAAAQQNNIVQIAFGGQADHPSTHFQGVATFATDQLLVAALIDQAVGIVAWQRSEQRTHEATHDADHLQIALRTSRQIGTAIGILMSQYKIKSGEAFELLSRASQRAHVKVHDLALDVIDTGRLDVSRTGLAGSTAGGGDR
jgi:hypothetical protein